MTKRRSKKIILGGAQITYHHRKPELLWGYVQEGYRSIAEPEKAIIDLLYLERPGLKKLLIDEIRWQEIDLQRLRQYAKKTGIRSLIKRVEVISSSRASSCPPPITTSAPSPSMIIHS